jgi:hypothetical protein
VEKRGGRRRRGSKRKERNEQGIKEGGREGKLSLEQVYVSV